MTGRTVEAEAALAGRTAGQPERVVTGVVVHTVPAVGTGAVTVARAVGMVEVAAVTVAVGMAAVTLAIAAVVPAAAAAAVMADMVAS